MVTVLSNRAGGAGRCSREALEQLTRERREHTDPERQRDHVHRKQRSTEAETVEHSSVIKEGNVRSDLCCLSIRARANRAKHAKFTRRSRQIVRITRRTCLGTIWCAVWRTFDPTGHRTGFPSLEIWRSLQRHAQQKADDQSGLLQTLASVDQPSKSVRFGKGPSGRTNIVLKLQPDAAMLSEL